MCNVSQAVYGCMPAYVRYCPCQCLHKMMHFMILLVGSLFMPSSRVKVITEGHIQNSWTCTQCRVCCTKSWGWGFRIELLPKSPARHVQKQATCSIRVSPAPPSSSCLEGINICQGKGGFMLLARACRDLTSSGVGSNLPPLIPAAVSMPGG